MSAPLEIIWSKKAERKLSKFPRPVAKRIIEKVDLLSENPFEQDVKKLAGLPYYRLRIGEYRVVFDLEPAQHRIIILLVDLRKNIYKM